LIAGRIVKLTPKGLFVIERVRWISLRSASGVGFSWIGQCFFFSCGDRVFVRTCVSAVNMPRPPALLTAEAISAVPTHCIPPTAHGRVALSGIDQRLNQSPYYLGRSGA